MKPRTWLRILKVWAVLLLLGSAGFLAVTSGIVPIKASSGHWAITAWLLEFAMTRSVTTHAFAVDKLKFDEPWLVMHGAGHYETACRPCHGSPDLPHPVIVQAMTPPPPHLPPEIVNWQPEQLFYIVKHGVKFTGMPAWPTQDRDDEVRAMVAFLLAFSKMDAEQYRRLVFGDTGTDESAAVVRNLPTLKRAPRPAGASCVRCHGADGLGRGNAAFPKLAGQRREYLLAALEAYANGTRHSGIMQPVAYGLLPEEKRALADHYANFSGDALAEARDERNESLALPTWELGLEISNRGIPSRGVPSCRDCHGPGPSPKNPAYPKLAGQYADYLVLQLELFKSGRRGGSAYAHIMSQVATRLDSEQMRAVALYYASLSSARELGVVTDETVRRP